MHKFKSIFSECITACANKAQTRTASMCARVSHPETITFSLLSFWPDIECRTPGNYSLELTQEKCVAMHSSVSLEMERVHFHRLICVRFDKVLGVMFVLVCPPLVTICLQFNEYSCSSHNGMATAYLNWLEMLRGLSRMLFFVGDMHNIAFFLSCLLPVDFIWFRSK